MIDEALAVALKDLRIEIRTRERLSSMLIFSLMVILSFRAALLLSLPSGARREEVEALAPSVLWITFFFAGMLGFTATFAKEKDRGALQGLLVSPASRFSIYVGKFISNLLLLLVVNFLSLFFFSVFFAYDPLHVIFPLLGIILLGTLGYVSIGVTVSAMSVSAKTREILLPILLIALGLFTVIMPSISATWKVLQGGAEGLVSEVSLVSAFILIYVTLASLLFDYVLGE